MKSEYAIEPFAKLETALYEVPAPENTLILANSMAKAIDETISKHNLVSPQVESVSSFAKGSIALIIQARVLSTRLPGKILLPLSDQPVLSYLLSNLQSFPHPIIVATTEGPEDDLVQKIALQHHAFCVRGSSEDVLSRYVKVVKVFPCETIIRLTADCPLHDVSLIEKALKLFQDRSVSYLSNTSIRTFPRGYDIEIFSKKALIEAFENSTHPYDREHVTPYIIRKFGQGEKSQFVDSEDFHSWRLTLDEKSDYVLLQKVTEELSSDRSYGSVKKILSKNPEWKKINEHVQQKST